MKNQSTHTTDTKHKSVKIDSSEISGIKSDGQEKDSTNTPDTDQKSETEESSTTPGTEQDGTKNASSEISGTKPNTLITLVNAVEMSPDQRLYESYTTALIIGRSGNGKSFIGNTILKEKKFESCTNNDIQLKCEVFTGNGFAVIDLAGVADSPEDSQVSDDKVYDKIRKALQEADKFGGIDAILFVLKYGVKLTKQEKDAVTRVKHLFGDNVFKDHVILAFSYRDLFDQDKCDDKYTFDNWCRVQTGDIKILFEEVRYRCVLFNNKSQLDRNTEAHLKDFIRYKLIDHEYVGEPKRQCLRINHTSSKDDNNTNLTQLHESADSEKDAAILKHNKKPGEIFPVNKKYPLAKLEHLKHAYYLS